MYPIVSFLWLYGGKWHGRANPARAGRYRSGLLLSYEQLAATIFTESTSRRCCDALDSVVVPVVPVVELVVEPVEVVDELELDISLPVTWIL